ncbi:MAG: bifunctional heptose 7-phosphate kinase/heptose 1-phosphate adenyltransferase, partial [Pyrinomonadaceae bacterium]
MSKLDNFSKVKVLVIGDVMLDKYLWGEVTRISPEAPVPVVRLKETGFIAGGAANVAANIAGLGAIARIIGIVGRDAEGEMIKETLEKSGVSSADIVTSETRRTTVKTRIIAHQQQIARLDEETCVELNAEEESAVWEVFVEAAAETHIFIVSDYQKGVLSQSLLSRLIKYAKSAGKKIFIDPKGRDYTKYRGATLITPNKFELAEVCGCRADEAANLNGAGEKLLSELGLEAIVITR